MKSKHPAKRQRGFFDLGLSVLVLALAGGVVYGVESSRAEQQSVAGAEDQPAAAVEVSAADSTVIAGSPQ